jgi:glycosyltransferase involved in cell wall biosynthesis
LSTINLRRSIRVGINLLSFKPFQMGGVESLARNLIREFQAQRSELLKFVYFASSAVYPRFADLAGRQDIVTIRMPGDSRLEKLTYVDYFLQKATNFNHIDALLNFEPMLMFRPKKFRTISIIHDLQHRDLRPRTSFLRWLWREFSLHSTCMFSDRLVCVSHFTDSRMRALFPRYRNKLLVIHNPIHVKPPAEKGIIDQVLSKRGLNAYDYCYVISASHYHKNLEPLVDCFNRYRSFDTLIITGPARGNQSRLDALAGPNIRFTGYIDDEEKFILLRHCRLFLFPSLYEGFGMPLAESLMIGRPVVTTRCGAIPEITCGRATYVNRPTCPQSWNDAIQKACSSRYSESHMNYFQYRYHSAKKADNYIGAITKGL